MKRNPDREDPARKRADSAGSGGDAGGDAAAGASGTGDHLLSEADLEAFAAGRLDRADRILGAHAERRNGRGGVRFAVWAPNAADVQVVGQFNGWNGTAHAMRVRHGGVWELFVPGLKRGDVYKYRIRSRFKDRVFLKADPYGFFMEERPNTASIVWNGARHEWTDAAWMAARAKRQAVGAPISIYELHPGSWKRIGKDNRWLSYRELAARLIPYVKEMGFTHIEMMPITEHPFDGSWGYQSVGYFAPTSRYGTPDDFKRFVDACHGAGLGVILDWVPAHFPRDGHGPAFFDGTHLYEHADPRKGHHKDWGTLIYNLSRPQVSSFLISSALFWLDEYHVDGFRVDAVASMLYLDYSRNEGEWEPNRYGGRENLEAIEFLKKFNTVVHGAFPGVLTFAEESTSWPMVTRPVHLGGLGFDYKWNMGWMNDMLEFMKHDPLYRKHAHDKLTFSLHYAFGENYLLPLSHDEVVHGKYSLLNKMPGDPWRRFANLRALLAYMFAHPGKKLLFMGAEFGQVREWNFDGQLDWDLLEDPRHAGVTALVKALNRLYAGEAALHEVDTEWAGFEWIDFRDVDSSIVSFVRKARKPEDQLVIAANFTPVPHEGYRIGVPRAGGWKEILNTDAEEFGGSGVVNTGTIESATGTWQERPQSVALRLPPLGVVILKPVPAKVKPAPAPSKAKAATPREAKPAGPPKDRPAAHAAPATTPAPDAGAARAPRRRRKNPGAAKPKS